MSAVTFSDGATFNDGASFGIRAVRAHCHSINPFKHKVRKPRVLTSIYDLPLEVNPRRVYSTQPYNRGVLLLDSGGSAFAWVERAKP